MSKPETLKPALALCSDCAWQDTCREDDLCTRARLTVLGFDTGMTTARAFELLGEDAIARIDAGLTTPPPSAIIEPPSAAELRGEARRSPACEDCPWPMQCGAHCLKRDVLKEVAPSVSSSATAPTFTRAQIRAAIDEISKAQPQVARAFELDEYTCECRLDAAFIQQLEQQTKTAASVLEALPEAVAHRFGLRIRCACADCGTTVFWDEPKITNAAGKDVCEACTPAEAA